MVTTSWTTVLNYLARYIHRVAITNSRIISADDGKVTFRYKGAGASQKKTMTVTAEEFIRRYLQHVLPAGVHKVRYYGLWSPSQHKSGRLDTPCRMETPRRPVTCIKNLDPDAI